MKPNLSEAFSLSVKEVLANLCQCEVTVSEAQPRDLSKTVEDITIILEMVGKIKGQIVYMMNKDFGLELASNMIGMPISEVDELDELGMSALSEIGNIITGSALTKLSDAGFYCETTIPKIILGKDKPLKVFDPLAMTLVSSTPIGNLNIGIISVDH